MTIGILDPLAKFQEEGVPLDLRLLPQYFQDAGYQTFMAGKWHIGHHTQAQHPNARGFDEYYGFLRGGIGYWDHVHGGGLDWQRNGATLREEGYSTHLLTDEAVRLIDERDRGRPFLLYLSYNAPHMPNEAPEDAIQRYGHIDDPNRRVHAAMVSELDAGIGRVVDTLAEQGLLENTLIWFMSDNGGLNRSAIAEPLANAVARLQDWFGAPLPLQGLEFLRTNILDSASDNSPLRKGKGSAYEGGVRVPSLVYWKGRLAARSLSHRLSVQDVLPTLAEATQIPLPSQQRIDGVSQWPLLSENVPRPSSDFMIHGRDGEAYIRGDWKLIVLNDADPELYNLVDYPHEGSSVAVQESQRVQDLQQAMNEFPRRGSVTPSLWKVFWDPDSFGG